MAEGTEDRTTYFSVPDILRDRKEDYLLFCARHLRDRKEDDSLFSARQLKGRKATHFSLPGLLSRPSTMARRESTTSALSAKLRVCFLS